MCTNSTCSNKAWSEQCRHYSHHRNLFTLRGPCQVRLKSTPCLSHLTLGMSFTCIYHMDSWFLFVLPLHDIYIYISLTPRWVSVSEGLGSVSEGLVPFTVPARVQVPQGKITEGPEGPGLARSDLQPMNNCCNQSLFDRSIKHWEIIWPHHGYSYQESVIPL